ncbi:MAG: hemerythrin domain-containing protein [Usitatibacter sp.]
MHPALSVIASEHRSIASVLSGLDHFATRGLRGGKVPDARVFRAMLQYLDLFAERMHHPKEDTYLFARLRDRTHIADAVLDRLQEDHFYGAAGLRKVEQAFLRYEEGGAPFFKDFAVEVRRYVDFYREHMRVEETLVFPLAERELDDEDWRAIEGAFAAHEDPLASPTQEHDLEALFTRIVTITPAPIGVGDEV